MSNLEDSIIVQSETTPIILDKKEEKDKNESDAFRLLSNVHTNIAQLEKAYEYMTEKLKVIDALRVKLAKGSSSLKDRVNNTLFLNQTVYAKFGNDTKCRYYKGKVVSIHEDGSADIEYYDGDKRTIPLHHYNDEFLHLSSHPYIDMQGNGSGPDDDVDVL